MSFGNRGASDVWVSGLMPFDWRVDLALVELAIIREDNGGQLHASDLVDAAADWCYHGDRRDFERLHHALIAATS